MAKGKRNRADYLFCVLKFIYCCVKQDSDEENFPSLEEIYKVNGAAAGATVEAEQIGLDFGGKFRDFDIIRLLGRGSFAKVVMVEEKSTRKVFAMKIIKKQFSDLSEKKTAEIVETERRVFVLATSCPFLVGLHACFQSPSRLFFVIDFASGGDMVSHMGRHGRLPEEHVRFYSAEISIALNFLHERGVAYRDLKLDNILLDRDGHIKLTDYGLCKADLQPGCVMSTFCGTHRYLSPELLRREKYGYSVDWWALGVTMFEMMAGRSPFDADDNTENYEESLSEAILYGALKTPPFMSGDAVSIVNGLLQKNPNDRLGFTGVQCHIFYCTVSWDRLGDRQVPPPFTPRVNSEQDVGNFDAEFTNQPPQLTPDNSNIAINGNRDEFFKGFEYDWETGVNGPGYSQSTGGGKQVKRQQSELLLRSPRLSFVDIKRASSVPATFMQ